MRGQVSLPRGVTRLAEFDNVASLVVFLSVSLMSKGEHFSPLETFVFPYCLLLFLSFPLQTFCHLYLICSFSCQKENTVRFMGNSLKMD
jgi:hypothetical protein